MRVGWGSSGRRKSSGSSVDLFSTASVVLFPIYFQAMNCFDSFFFRAKANDVGRSHPSSLQLERWSSDRHNGTLIFFFHGCLSGRTSFRPQTHGLTSPDETYEHLFLLRSPYKRLTPDRHQNSYPVHEGPLGALDERSC